jgi:dTDP-4-dehydrorhamnose reductase
MRVLLLGGNGFVGESIKKFLTKKKISFYAPSSKKLNLKEINQIENFLTKKKISHIINSAGKVGGIQRGSHMSVRQACRTPASQPAS